MANPLSLCAGGAQNGNTRKPHWDIDLRKLWLGDTLLKVFRRKAPIAELIFSAFQEEGWPERIYDPLIPWPTRGKQSDRLRHEVQAINRRLTRKLIRFLMDGTGEGICWQLARLRR